MQEKIYNKSIIAFSMIVSLSLLLMTYIAIPIAYMTNDDFWIMTELGGYFVNNPPVFHWYLNPIFSWFVSNLYEWVPFCNWYPLLHIIAIFISVFIINICIYKYGKRLSIHPLFSLILCVLCYILLFCYPASTLSFTVTPAILATGAIAMLLTFSYCNKYWQFLVLFESSMMFICFIWREDTGKALLCFFLLALFYRGFRDQLDISVIEKKKRGKLLFRDITCLLLVIISIISAILVKEYVYALPQYSNYVSFEQSRIKYMDYPHEYYCENPERYEDAGINESLAALVNEWFFMDENVTAEAFEELNDYAASSTQLIDGLKQSITNRSFSKLSEEHALVSISFASLFVLFAMIIGLLSSCIKHPQQKMQTLLLFFSSLFAFGGCGLLLLSLYAKQRLLLRVYLVVIIPAIIFLLFLFLEVKKMRTSCPPKETKHFWVPRNCMIRGSIFLKYVLLALILILYTKTLNSEIGENEKLSRYSSFEETNQLFDLAQKHPENIYIYDLSLSTSIDPKIYYRVGKGPSNLLFYGGCSMFAPSYYEQIQQLGLNEMYADIFLQDNVYFVAKDWGTYNLLYAYLAEKYGVQRMELTETINGNIGVYQYYLQ